MVPLGWTASALATDAATGKKIFGSRTTASDNLEQRNGGNYENS